MVEERYSNEHVVGLSGGGATAVSRWKRQYRAEQRGEVVEEKVALDGDKCRLQILEKELTDTQTDISLT